LLVLLLLLLYVVSRFFRRNKTVKGLAISAVYPGHFG
jgi:hypothetical protein